jgi:hypothetical protein
MAIRVFIATTEGPAEIQRITKEDPLVRSVVCLDGKAIRLPIGGSYDDFVRDPTGVIERAFGHGSFRLDLGRAITDGYSWQLAVFAAHALLAAGKLAGANSSPEAVLWATGEVDRDLTVRRVEHLPQKLRQSQELFDRLCSEETPLIIAIPSENMSELDPAWIEARNLVGDNLRFLPVASVRELCDAIGISLPDRSASSGSVVVPQNPVASPVPAASGRWRRPVAVLSLLAAILIGGWLVQAWWNPSGRSEGPASPSLALEIAAYRVGKGGQCPTDGKTGLAAMLIDKTASDRFSPTSLKDLCALEFRISADGEPAYVWGFAQTVPERTYLLADRQSLLHEQAPRSGTRYWVIRPPKGLKRPLTYHFVGMSSKTPLTEPAQAMLRSLFGDSTRPYAPDWAAAKKRLKAAHVTVVSTWHQLMP